MFAAVEIYTVSFHLDHLAYTGAADRFAKNIAALQLLHALETERRPATEDERRTLAHYSAFGESANLNKLFQWNQTESRYALHPEYAALLDAADAKHLRRTALTAFYTPVEVVQAIWRAVERLGIGTLPHPRIIEPALGVGHFISAMPPALRASAEITAVELDPLSARIARQIHPDITLHAGIGFEAVELPTNWFDLAISNVPFGDMAIHDPLVEPALRRTIHDYFFAKALRSVRLGGLVVFLTSWGTLDKATPTVRRFLATHTDLLGAFRLPNGVFRAMSGSESATDLLILQKKAVPDNAHVHWLGLAEADYPRTTDRNLTTGSRYTREITDADELAAQRVSVNQLWLAEPERVIGLPCVVVADNSLWLQVRPPHSGIAPALDAQMQRLLPENVLRPRDDYSLLDDGKPKPSVSRSVGADVLTLPPFDEAREARATALTAIYTTAKALIKRELNNDPDVERTREQLNTVYDQFVRQWGAIHDPRTQRLFRDVPELAFLLALECNPRQDTRGRWRADKERIFRERTLRPVQGVLPGTLTPTEALLHCLDERGQLDLPRIAELCGQDVPQTVAALGDRIFPLPGTARYELADVYLSGNVRAKLREAQTWAERAAVWERNVAALQAVQPMPLGPGEIIVNLNAVWLPDDVVTDFIKVLLPRFVGEARYNHSLGEWRIIDTYNAGTFSVEARSKWGTKRVNAMDILEASLKGIPITVYDEIKVGDGTRRVLNPAETVAAQEKQEEIKRHWEQWVWADPDRVTRLCHIYNERFNSIRMRSYNGQHLSFPGMVTHILRDGDLAAYQKDAVWQILQSPSALLAFAVGGGKTFTSVAAIAEAKRMGLVNKPLAVVPNNLVGQWANEARRLYPGMRVLAMGPEDFEKARRSTVLSRIATGDWDLVIVAETSAKFLPLGEGLLEAFRDKETDRLRAYLEELRATATSSDQKRSLKQIERAVAKLEARFDSMAAAIRRDSDRAITWHELGIDMLIVDEAHCFKNLFVASKLTNIAGLPRGNSQRALDMRIKTWDVLQNGGKVVFLTATPIMNTLGEAYVMQLFLQEATLEASGIHHFDEWVSLYAQPRMSFEMKPDGSGFRMNTRLNTFVNLPEMSAMWRQVMNVRTKQQMGLPEPELVTGKPIPVVVPPSAALKRFVQSLGERAERIRRGQVDPSTDNMLKITSEGRKAALDMRLVFPGTKRRARCKIGELVTRVKLLYDTFDACKGTQIVFCDLATPKGASQSQAEKKTTAASSSTSGDDADQAKEEVETTEETRLANFVYYEIRDELMQRGIPKEEIAFIHDYKTKEGRDALFAAMNDGRVRVLLGSTNKMSTGMNVQRRLVALHDLDCPWRPGDLEQRHGRIQRQGNLLPEVYIFAYITEGSFDGFLWQTVESKARFIAQAMAGEITARSIEDTSDAVLSAAEVKAIASGNPRIVRKVQLETEIGRMERVRAVHRDTEVALRMDRRQAERRMAELQARAAVLEAAHAAAAAVPHDGFRAEVATQLGHHTLTTFSKRAEAGEALRRIVEQYEAAAAFQRDTIAWIIGRYRGFELRLKVHPHVSPELVLRLPDGAPVGVLALRTDTGVFQSADSLLANLPESQRQVAAHIADTEQRIREIDAELGRMAVWDGQAAYDAARAELKAINDDFAAIEQALHAAPSAVSDAATDCPSVEEHAATGTLAPEIVAAVTALLDDDDDAMPPEEARATFPPALRSLAWMEAELQRGFAVHVLPHAEDVPAIDAAAEVLDELAEHTARAALSEITESPTPEVPVWKEVPVVAPKRRRQSAHAAVGVQLAFF